VKLIPRLGASQIREIIFRITKQR